MPRDNSIRAPGKASKASRNRLLTEEPRSERRIITALCYDIVGSTNLFQLLDIEDYKELIDSFQQAVKASITANSGFVQMEAGDGGLALFPMTLGMKDAAALAIRAGLDIVQDCKRVGKQAGRSDLQVRVGIATSSAIVHDAQSENWTQERVTGAALALATRLESIAAPGTVFVSDEARSRAGRSYSFAFEGSRDLKGFAEPEKVWRALKLKKHGDRFHAFGKFGNPFIGRKTELEQITQCWKRVCSGTGEVLVIEGEPGIGKSRLLHELRKITRQGRAQSLFFQCSPAGARSPLHPLFNGLGNEGEGQSLTRADIESQFARHGITHSETIDVFAYLLGARDAGQAFAGDPKSVHGKARRMIAGTLKELSANGPVILAVEDLHWIDPTSQDLLSEAAAIIHQNPVLLLLTTRTPGFPQWMAPLNRTYIHLQPLDSDETRQAMVTKLPEHTRSMLPDLLEITERISGGVPLFIEEICHWIAENNTHAAIMTTGHHSSVHASIFEEILDARLTNLGFAKDVASAAAIIGGPFNLPLLQALLRGSARKLLAGAVEKLCEAGVLIPIRVRGTKGYGFRHALILQSIYTALLRKQRQTLHRRLFEAVRDNQGTASWFSPAELATHAEHGGLTVESVSLFIDAGLENSRRSAMVEARQNLEHALMLCDQISDHLVVEPLRLAALSALGPVVTGLVGSNSPQARQLYEDGVAIARRQPPDNQSRWFPIYWGWWLTGADFRIMHDRAREVQTMQAGVDDPEIQLQVNHCIWAISFNLGRHEEALNAVAAGLSLYDADAAKASRTLFGGHDAKVCGLGQRALSLWLTGNRQASDETLWDMIAFADQIAHTPSKAHSFDTEVVSAFYRNEYDRIAEIAGRMTSFAERNEMQSLSGLALLFRGWANAHVQSLPAGHQMFQDGLSVLQQLGSVIDLPIYLYMHAVMLGLAGKYDTAVAVTTDAIEKSSQTGHAYWLAELYRCRASLLVHGKIDRRRAVEDFRSALQIADDQGASALLRRAQTSVQECGFVL